MEESSTALLIEKVRKYLKLNQIRRKRFSKLVLGISESRLSALLGKPKPWGSLSKREVVYYRRLQEWMDTRATYGNNPYLKKRTPSPEKENWARGKKKGSEKRKQRSLFERADLDHYMQLLKKFEEFTAAQSLVEDQQLQESEFAKHLSNDGKCDGPVSDKVDENDNGIVDVKEVIIEDGDMDVGLYVDVEVDCQEVIVDGIVYDEIYTDLSPTSKETIFVTRNGNGSLQENLDLSKVQFPHLLVKSEVEDEDCPVTEKLMNEIVNQPELFKNDVEKITNVPEEESKGIQFVDSITNKITFISDPSTDASQVYKYNPGVTINLPQDTPALFLQRWETYLKTGRQPRARKFIGAILMSVTEELGKLLKEGGVCAEGRGVLVCRVLSGSPAHLAGLAPGDCVVEVNRAMVFNLGDFYNKMELEQCLHCKVIRDGQLKSDVTIEPIELKDYKDLKYFK